MKNLLFLSFAAFLFACIFACTQSGSHSAAQVAAKSGDGIVQPFMDPEQATRAFYRWDTTRPHILDILKTSHSPQDAHFISRGFHVPLNDLQRILDSIGDPSKLYAMLAIQDSAGIPGHPQITLIFQAPDKTKTLRYYDFTQPCPYNCPDVQ